MAEYVVYVHDDSDVTTITMTFEGELIRCKDCENWQTDWCTSTKSPDDHYCAMVDLVTGKDFFCKYCERRKIKDGE